MRRRGDDLGITEGLSFWHRHPADSQAEYLCPCLRASVQRRHIPCAVPERAALKSIHTPAPASPRDDTGTQFCPGKEKKRLKADRRMQRKQYAITVSFRKVQGVVNQPARETVSASSDFSDCDRNSKGGPQA